MACLNSEPTRTGKLRNDKFKSSRPGVFYKKGILRKSAKFTGKQLCQSLFVNKAVGLRPLVAASVCFSSLDNQERKLRMKYFGSLFGGVRHRFIINISIAWFPPMRLTCSHVYSYENKYNLTCGNALNNLKKINLKIFHEIISLFS